MARLFYGWVVVAGAFVVLFVAYGAQYSFGVFFAALLDEFGWRRASLAGALSLYAFAYSVMGFPAGRLTDAWGPRRVIVVGGCFLGVALAGMATVTQLWQPYLLYGVVAAIGMGAAYVSCHATIVKWFVERRGLAVGIASSGLGFAPLVGASVISALGFGAVAGRLSMSAVSDWIGRRAAVAVGMGLQSAAFMSFLGVHGLAALFTTAFVFGYSYGTVSTLFTALVGDFFGRTHAGTMVGVLFALAGSMAG